ncbi:MULTISPECIES: DUF6165 family protein [Pseudomonadati]|uniref:DUF6165 family protein n=1 Tax=unclassified Halobacteriovorax TaxID=2639665 RepID=UPI000CD14FB9|nr:DUF6165 family protein [Halobacteriovorax sp. DA5]POB12460.1 hypothetical protein C0Z22_14990 [Halobacteriovorax sp. DA5]
MIIECPVSLGELVDKMTILKIKTERIEDNERVSLAQAEYDELAKTLAELNLEGIESFMSELKEINERLWVIEDDIRLKEKEADFGEEFISLARSVYKTNDLRFKVKNSINMSYNSGIKEVKSYK